MTVHAVVAVAKMDYDGIADRVIHYCQDNKIDYKATVPDSAFTDADGIDDVKLITAFNAATNPTISPATPVPADAVTASGSGLDPHISPANAQTQAARVADARKMKVEKVNEMIEQFTDGASLGFLGDPGVNVLRLNLGAGPGRRRVGIATGQNDLSINRRSRLPKTGLRGGDTTAPSRAPPLLPRNSCEPITPYEATGTDFVIPTYRLRDVRRRSSATKRQEGISADQSEEHEGQGT